MTPTETAASTSAAGWRHGRRTLVAVGVALAAIALVVDPIARDTFSGGRSLDLGLLQLRPAYNTGVAFSLGDQLPTAVVLAVTAAITATIGVFARRTAPDSRPIQTIGLAAIVAGATANVIDRRLPHRLVVHLQPRRHLHQLRRRLRHRRPTSQTNAHTRRPSSKPFPAASEPPSGSPHFARPQRPVHRSSKQDADWGNAATDH